MGRSQIYGLWAVSCKSVLLGGEGSRHTAWCGGQPSVGKPMRKCSCAVPCGSAEVAERQGEGRAAGWILPSLTLEQVLPVAICGRCCL